MSGANHDDDNVSVLTNGSQMSVWSQAAMILRGENPNAILEAEDEDENEGSSHHRSEPVPVPVPEQSLACMLKDCDDSESKINFLEDDPKVMVGTSGFHLTDWADFLLS